MVKGTYKRQWNTNFVREKRKRLSDSEREALNSQRREKYAERLKEKRQAKALLKLTSKRPADYMREKRMKAKVAREVEIANLAAVLETLKQNRQDQYASADRRYPSRTRKPVTYNDDPKTSLDWNKEYGWFVKADNYIKPGSFVFKYDGQRITEAEMEVRVAAGADKIMQLGGENVFIDGLYSESLAAFTTHACDCTANCISHIERGEVVISSKVPIQQGEMITMDYGFNPGNNKNLRWLRKYKCSVCKRHSRLADNMAKK